MIHGQKRVAQEIKDRELRMKNMNSTKAMIKVLEEYDNRPYEEWDLDELKQELDDREIKYKKNAKEKL